MDSLLDTVTNVVGILVILLAVTQIGVATAVRRIQENLPEISPEQYREMRAAWEQAEDRLAALREERDQLGAEPPADPKALEQLRREVADLEAKADNLPKKPPDVDRLRSEIAANDKQVAQLEKQIQEAEKRLAKLKAQLDQTPKLTAPPPTVVHLPDPRPAPEGAQPLKFLCRQGRCLYVNEDDLVEKAMTVIRGHARELDPRPVRDPRGRVQRVEFSGPKIQDLFKRYTVGTPNVELGIYVYKYGRHPYLEVRPREGRGETVEQLALPNSRCARLMTIARRSRAYVRFLVWPDGYEAYLAARKVADKQRVPAGWKPHNAPYWRTLLTEVWIRRLEEPPPPPDKPEPKDDKSKNLPDDVID